MSTAEALRIAEQRGLDLVLIAPQAAPPVCRIMDYGKFRFEQQKREKDQRKNQKIVELKEIRLSLNIGEHDFATKVGHAVVRNRIRRRLREIYRLHEPGFRQGVSLVIVARARAASADYHRLETELLKACRQLEIYADVQSAAQAPASGGAEG